MQSYKLARIISFVLSPNTYSLFVYTLYWYLKRFSEGLIALFILFLFISFLPFIFVYIDMIRGKTDIFVSKREERMKYYILTLFSYFLGLMFLNILDIDTYNLLFLTNIFVGILLFIQNTRYKISIHAADIAGPTTLLVAVYDSHF